MRKGFWCVLLIVLCVAVAGAQVVRKGQNMVPSGKGFGIAGGPDAPAIVTPDTVHTGNGINYHNGPIMPNTPNVYLIFYGNWTSGPHPSDRKATKTLIKQFITGISGSGYEMINSTYGDNSNDVSGLVHLGGATGMAYPFGSNLSDFQIQQAVQKAINRGSFPLDNNAVYFVLTSSDVAQGGGGFCGSYCGWHTHGSINGQDIKYSFVGNPDRCSSSCEEQTISPNNNSGGDGMANIIAHELEEAISDPDLNAWYDTFGAENADKCAWKWGDLLPGSPPLKQGAYNENFGGHNWLLQMNWENARGGGCDNFLGGPFHNN